MDPQAPEPSPPSGAPGPQQPPPDVRLLRVLVVALAVVMIAGMVSIVALLALRLSPAPAPLALPEGLQLPPGARPETASFGRDWVLVVTEAGEILIFDRADGRLRQTLRIAPQGAE